MANFDRPGILNASLFQSRIMGLLRRLVRALFPSRKPSYRHQQPSLAVPVVPRRKGSALTPAQAHPPHHTNILVRQSIEITVVDIVELRGPAWVVDGDTIDIQGKRIRLAGIDAPEMDHPYGKNAKWTLVNLCKGQEVRAVFEGDLSHERLVATCYLPDGRDLSAEMVKAGLAIDWPKFSGRKYAGLEAPGIRKKLWRCDARQKGLMPPTLPD